jgi:hypothetical protein
MQVVDRYRETFPTKKKGDKKMKYRTTRKAIVSSIPAEKLFFCHYCEAQYLLSGHAPVAYTSGVYGWNYDVYNVYGITICTGYRGMPGKRAKNVAAYDLKARSIRVDRAFTGYEKDELREKLLKEFCEQA